jgi:hypothetical protein
MGDDRPQFLENQPRNLTGTEKSPKTFQETTNQ